MNARNATFVGFAMAPADVPVAVVITRLAGGPPPARAQLYPLRAAAAMAPLSLSGRAVTVLVDRPRQVCVVLDGQTDAPFCIFADPPETYVPQPGDAGVIYFASGTTRVPGGVIPVAPGQTVYLAPGAHVYGRVALAGAPAPGLCTRAKTVAVRGRGVLDGHDFLINDEGPSLVDLPCEFALVEGVTMIDSPKYHVDGGWPYTTVAWVKALSWAFSTDGFSGGAREHDARARKRERGARPASPTGARARARARPLAPGDASRLTAARPSPAVPRSPQRRCCTIRSCA
jgi:hypothetical protein